MIRIKWLEYDSWLMESNPSRSVYQHSQHNIHLRSIILSSDEDTLPYNVTSSSADADIGSALPSQTPPLPIQSYNNSIDINIHTIQI